MNNKIDANDILKAKKCGDIFTNDPDKAKSEYWTLAKKYHPDINKSVNADKVLRKLNELYDEATKLFKSGQWEVSNYIEITSKTGKVSKVRYFEKQSFEIGTLYIARTVLVYVINSTDKKYYDNAINAVKQLNYRDSSMKDEFSRYLPNVIDSFESIDGRWIIVMQKTADVFALKDILNYYKGNIEDRHVAWVISRLCNLCCFIKYNNLSHNGISLDSCFVSPQYHSILLLGGWWYCVPIGEKMIGTQKQIFDIMPPKVKSDKVGSIETDIESVKLLGKTLLGTTKAPDAFTDWLNSGMNDDAIKVFKAWNKALDESYGARKFIPMNIKESDIYE